jgi:hypothetical protein
MKNAWKLMMVLLSVVALASCQSSKPKYDGPSPVDMMTRDLDKEKTYSVVLYDMQMDESKGLYEHKYKITKDIENEKSNPEITGWKKVSEQFFAENLDNMGLELASKSPDGKVHKAPSPPGFNGVVGNEKYGQWKTDNSGNSFWAFYGQYMFMSTMLNMVAGPPIYRNSYYAYDRYRSNPSTRGMAYYGSGSNTYGTNSPANKASNPNFFARKQQQSQLSSFKQKVMNNPTKYTRASRLNTTPSTTTKSSDAESRSRSTTRTGTSSRSRGGSFGK